MIILRVTVDTIPVKSEFSSTTGSYKKVVKQFLKDHPGITTGTVTIQKVTKTWYVDNDEIKFI